MRSTAKFLYGSAKEKRKKIRTSGFLLLLLRFVLKKKAQVKELNWSEPRTPSEQSFSSRRKMAFGKHLNFEAL